MQARIIHVAVLVEDDDRFDVADTLNEILRLAVHDRKMSGVIDYCFNADGNCPSLQPPQSVIFSADEYRECDFVSWIGHAPLPPEDGPLAPRVGA